MKVHLVDGTYELFRAHYGGFRSRDAEGNERGAVRTLLRSLVALLKRDDVSHVACAFDHVIESFRNDMFDGYKTGEGVEPELRAQFEPAEAAARALGLVVWPMVEMEADDALASATLRYAEAEGVEQVVICSPDKDLMQCVRGTRVVLWDRRRDRVLDEAAVHEKLGVGPGSVPDWLALVGDAADGIPGVPRWGAKSAATVLARYGHLEDIPPDAARWDIKVRGAEALARSLCESAEQARLYRTLATLRTDVPIEEPLDALRWRGPDWKILHPLAGTLNEQRTLHTLQELAPRATK